MKRYLMLILASILTISILLFVGCSNTATSPQEPTAVEQAAKEATEQKRMELVTRLQQVNDELVRNMEEIFEVMDEINRLNGAISSSMQRIQQAYADLNDKVLGEFPSWRGAAQSTIDQENQNISYYKFEIGKNRAKLRELQEKQLELEKERGLLLTELAKIGE